MNLFWSSRARNDLITIALYIAADNPAAARKHVIKLQAKAEAATKNPHANRIVPEMRRNDIREVLSGNYRIIYQIEGDILTVQTVLEGHRLLRLK